MKMLINAIRTENDYIELENGTRLYNEDWNGEVYEGSTSDDGIHFHNNGTQFRPVFEQNPDEDCNELLGYEEA